MARLEQFLVLHLGAADLVVVVGNVDFLLAQQLPVIAVRRAVEHIGVVGGAQAVGGGDRRVVGKVRRTPHTALAGVVAPGLARLLDLVEGLVHQHRATGQARRALGERQVVEHQVVQVGEAAALEVVLEQRFLLRGHQRVATVALYRDFRGAAHDIGTAVAGDMVPQRLHAALRNRERHPAIGVGEPVAAVQQPGAGGIGEGVVVQPLRRRAGTATGVDRHPEAVRVGLEQRQLARGQVFPVLLQVGLVDGEQRLVRGERVRVVLARLVAGRRLGDAAGPGGNAAGGVAGLLRAQRGEARLQLRRLAGGNAGQRAAAAQCQRQGSADQQVLVQHEGSPCEVPGARGARVVIGSVRRST